MTLDSNVLETLFGDRLERNVVLSSYTSARVGGQADYLITVNTIHELVESVTKLWSIQFPFVLLGGGSNILVSDLGVREVVIHNQARQVRFSLESNPTVVAESGANFGVIARQAAVHGLAGLEWACGIPGTVGGAIVGNAGAHGSDITCNLLVADILHCSQCTTNEVSKSDTTIGSSDFQVNKEVWPIERFEFGYRRSIIGGQFCNNNFGIPNPPIRKDGLMLYGKARYIILAAEFHLEHSKKELVQEKMDKYLNYRRRTQPPGASMGSMFKNPPGDYAGRIIEAAGLKGTRIGGAEISLKHANFIKNHGTATATDIYSLLQLTHRSVQEKFGVNLELEIGLIGDWR